MTITTQQIKQAKPNSRLHDGRGLYLHTSQTGYQCWRYKYRIRRGPKRVEKLLTLGPYPALSLTEARDLHLKAMIKVKEGKDPSQIKQTHRRKAAYDRLQTFGELTRNWFKNQSATWSAHHQERQKRLLFVDLKPLHRLTIGEIQKQDIMQTLNLMIKRGVNESARRALGILRQIFEHACARGLRPDNPAAGMETLIPPGKEKHYAAPITEEDYRSVIRQIWAKTEESPVGIALRLCPLLLVRPGNIRYMEWKEIGEDGIWRIPAQKMKLRNDHQVPLSTQVLAQLDLLRPTNGRRDFVFASHIKPTQPISENALLQRLRKIGIDNDTVSPHGFRASGRTLLAEQLGYRPDWVEHQLAHKVRDTDGRAYNRTQFLAERVEMMQAWSDYSLEGIEKTAPPKRNVNRGKISYINQKDK